MTPSANNIPETLNETVWRGLRIAHPWDWELALVSGPNVVGRCSFVDRHYQRMEVYWRPVAGEVKTELVLSQHRKEEKGVEITALPDTPGGFDALVRTYQDMQRTHAVRFFGDVKLLVEVAIIWPGQRDETLEEDLLSAIEPCDPKAETVTWDAFGLCVHAGRSWLLADCQTQVGQVKWTFQPPEGKPKKGPTMEVFRSALPERVLGHKPSLREYLTAELPEGCTVRTAEPVNHHTHQGMRLISRVRRSPAAAVLGIHTLRFDEAWICDVENRLYRLTLTRRSRDEEIAWPEGVTVDCCRRTPITEGTL